jgi:lysophospholipase L1-like esterase
VEDPNAAIPAWAAGKSTAASPVYPADIWSAVPAPSYVPNSTYTDDGTHPKVAAAQLTADAWYAALAAKGLP